MGYIYIYHISSNFICFFYIIETYRNYEYDKIRYVKNMRICDKTKLSTQFIMHVYIYISYIYIYGHLKHLTLQWENLAVNHLPVGIW